MIKDPPLLRIRRRFARPPEAVVASLAGVATGHLVDAMGGRGCLSHAIRPLFPDNASLVGVALTCHAGPADNLAVFAALDAARRGDIIVAGTDAFMATAVVGDLLLGMARNRGVAGLVTDGLVRDIPGLLEVGLPIFCAGVTANSPARNGPGSVGLPVVLGGVAVHPGDVLVADRDGVVVVPREQLEEIVARLEPIRAAERDLEAKVRGGLEVPDFVRAILVSGQVEMLD